MYYLKNQKGFTVFEVVLVIVTLAAICAATYFAYLNYNKKQDSSKTQTTKQETQTGKSQLSQQDLDEASKSAECFEKGLDYSFALTGETMESISVNPNELVTSKNSDGERTYYARWSSKIPKVVDVKCNIIKLSDIKKGDKLNLYIFDDELLGIQKLK